MRSSRTGRSPTTEGRGRVGRIRPLPDGRAGPGAVAIVVAVAVAVAVAGQRPFQTGSRFSMKAFGPSRASSDPITAAESRCSMA